MCGTTWYKASHMKSMRFECDDELAAWLEGKADDEHRKVASMIRVILYEAKYAEEARQLEASA